MQTPIPTFLSYDPRDGEDVAEFVQRFPGPLADLRSTGISADDDLVSWTDPKRIVEEVGRRYVGDAHIALVLLGPRTWTRRFVDWALAAAADQGCGVLALPLGPAPCSPPARAVLLAESGRALLRHRVPTSDDELSSWMTAARETPASTLGADRSESVALMQRDAMLRVR